MDKRQNIFEDHELRLNESVFGENHRSALIELLPINISPLNFNSCKTISGDDCDKSPSCLKTINIV